MYLGTTRASSPSRPRCRVAPRSRSAPRGRDQGHAPGDAGHDAGDGLLRQRAAAGDGALREVEGAPGRAAPAGEVPDPHRALAARARDGVASTGKTREAQARCASCGRWPRRCRRTLGRPEPRLGHVPARRRRIEARIAERARRWPEAIAAWQRAVTQEDGFAYDEPADWFYPMRHYLGAALLERRSRRTPRPCSARTSAGTRTTAGRSTGSRTRSPRRGRRTRPGRPGRFDAAWKEADIRLTRAAL